jgi:hypothetical protein
VASDDSPATAGGVLPQRGKDAGDWDPALVADQQEDGGIAQPAQERRAGPPRRSSAMATRGGGAANRYDDCAEAHDDTACVAIELAGGVDLWGGSGWAGRGAVAAGQVVLCALSELVFGGGFGLDQTVVGVGERLDELVQLELGGLLEPVLSVL